uniref:Ig-like domain-containing protein n=1 Tax=Neolamprologus brichardi TaxID=32507 RepID=A0A3Q4HHS2_NEOBR
MASAQGSSGPARPTVWGDGAPLQTEPEAGKSPTALENLLCCWISVLAFEFHTVEVQPGEEVTLQCSNLSSYRVHLSWFRSTNRPKASKISSIISPDSSVTFNEGFQNGKFSMTSNTSVLFLEIKQVDSSDSGLYFCGELKNEKFIVYGATNLKVQGKIQLKHVLFLLPNVDSDVMITAGLSFPPRTKIRRRVPQRELETNVVYAATR